MRSRIIISGGGIAGMTAAKLLGDQGHEITVIDKANDLIMQVFWFRLRVLA